MVPLARSKAAAYNPVHGGGQGRGLAVTLKVLVLLALWAAAFIAFLMAPLIVLGVAWIVGLAALALRHRGGARGPGPAAANRSPQPHRFGAARTETETQA